MSEIEKTTPRPWRTERNAIFDADGDVVAECFWAHGDDTADLIVKAVGWHDRLIETLMQIKTRAKSGASNEELGNIATNALNMLEDRKALEFGK